MTVNEITQTIAAITQSGDFETLEAWLRNLGQTVSRDHSMEELAQAMAVLREARNAIYTQRAHIVTSLQQLERQSLYNASSPNPGGTWEYAA